MAMAMAIVSMVWYANVTMLCCSYFHEMVGRVESTIREVRFTNFDDPTVSFFVRECERRYGHYHYHGHTHNTVLIRQ